MSYLITVVISVLVGAVGMYFVLKNNPKYIEIEKISSNKLLALKSKIEVYLTKTNL